MRQHRCVASNPSESEMNFMKANTASFACVLLCAVLMNAFSSRAADAGYHLLKEIPVREGGAWTGMTIDEAGHRLYAAHGNRIEVINLNTEAPLGAITDTADVRGFAIAPSFHIGYATSGKERSASLIDLSTLRTTAKMKTGADARAIVYEPSKLQLFAFNLGDHSATAGEADDGDFLTTIDLGGRPAAAISDSANYESKTGRIFCALDDKNEVIAIEAESHKISNRWPVAPGQSPCALAYDPPNHRLFVACNSPLLAVMDVFSGKVVTTLPLADWPAGVAFDTVSQCVFISTIDGTVAIAHEDTPDSLAPVQTVKTKPGVNLLAVDGKARRFYVGTAGYRVPGDYRAPNPSPIPGSLRISVYGQ
jgi:DNA-binding beta-propeller fold protein YncE